MVHKLFSARGAGVVFDIVVPPDVPLEGLDAPETLSANGADVAGFGVDARHVTGQERRVDKGFLAEVTFRNFFTRVAVADVSERKKEKC